MTFLLYATAVHGCVLLLITVNHKIAVACARQELVLCKSLEEGSAGQIRWLHDHPKLHHLGSAAL